MKDAVMEHLKSFGLGLFLMSCAGLLFYLSAQLVYLVCEYTATTGGILLLISCYFLGRNCRTEFHKR